MRCFTSGEHLQASVENGRVRGELLVRGTHGGRTEIVRYYGDASNGLKGIQSAEDGAELTLEFDVFLATSKQDGSKYLSVKALSWGPAED